MVPICVAATTMYGSVSDLRLGLALRTFESFDWGGIDTVVVDGSGL